MPHSILTVEIETTLKTTMERNTIVSLSKRKHNKNRRLSNFCVPWWWWWWWWNGKCPQKALCYLFLEYKTVLVCPFQTSWFRTVSRWLEKDGLKNNVSHIILTHLSTQRVEKVNVRMQMGGKSSRHINLCQSYIPFPFSPHRSSKFRLLITF